MILRFILGAVAVVAVIGCASGPARAPLPVSAPFPERSIVMESPLPSEQPSAERWAPAHTVVFAPHPDDETLGAGGVIMQAVAAGKRVHVVIFTNGDGYPHAASLLRSTPVELLRPADYLELARVRQLEVYDALAVLGLSPEDVTFLGYPDAGLDKVYETTGEERYTQRFTGKSETYGAAAPDFHTLMHGQGAPYRKEAVLGDVIDLLQRLQPQEVYVTHAADTHLDHQAAHWFVRDALVSVGYTGRAHTYLIHDGVGWPWPRGATPTQPYAAHVVEGELVPRGAEWPPPLRGALTEEEALRKLRAIHAYPSQLAAAREALESYAKAEEIFWYMSTP